MKITYINSVFNMGSTGNLVSLLSSRLKDENVQIIYGRNENGVIGKYRNTKCNFYVDVVKSIILANAGLNSRRNTKKIIEEIDDFSPDLIHIHNLHGFYINYKLLFEYLNYKKIKIIITAHDCWLLTGFCGSFDGEGCYRWKESCSECPHKNIYPYRLFKSYKTIEKNHSLKRKIFDNSNITIVTPSTWLFEQFKGQFNNAKLAVINNAVDLNRFKRSKNETKSNLKILLSVAGVWTQKKGLYDLLALSIELPKDYAIWIVGLTKKQSRNLPNNVVGINKLSDRNELAKIYNQSYLFLNMTHEDNFPTVNIEALACGLPIISYNTGGSPEIVGSCGKVVEKGNISQFLDAILRTEVTDAMRDDCEKRAKNLYNQNKMWYAYESLYDKINSERKEG